MLGARPRPQQTSSGRQARGNSGEGGRPGRASLSACRFAAVSSNNSHVSKQPVAGAFAIIAAGAPIEAPIEAKEALCLQLQRTAHLNEGSVTFEPVGMRILSAMGTSLRTA
jgi:hypothetical protein